MVGRAEGYCCVLHGVGVARHYKNVPNFWRAQTGVRSCALTDGEGCRLSFVPARMFQVLRVFANRTSSALSCHSSHMEEANIDVRFHS